MQKDSFEEDFLYLIGKILIIGIISRCTDWLFNV